MGLVGLGSSVTCPLEVFDQTPKTGTRAVSAAGFASVFACASVGTPLQPLNTISVVAQFAVAYVSRNRLAASEGFTQTSTSQWITDL